MATKQDSVDLMDETVEDYYSDLDECLRRIRYMNIARWKLAQQTAISLLIAALALEAGANPTVSVTVIAIINGISIADVAAIWGVPEDSHQTDSVDDEPETEAEQR